MKFQDEKYFEKVDFGQSTWPTDDIQTKTETTAKQQQRQSLPVQLELDFAQTPHPLSTEERKTKFEKKKKPPIFVGRKNHFLKIISFKRV